ncbi:unnamed protein product [Clonostachys rosea]|uniref:monoamine oxidase n=1 Tax=Bionectria ochroleuca TaxID=29856 RepID=A0ABY6UFX8_BIOOC|nr:unnamed protein product [Clonostachys rosea]
MRFLTQILPFLVAGVATGTPCSSNDTVLERDVVVIGGGSSGTYAAIRLMDQGHSVVVLEKNDHLGGHTVTYTDPDTNKPFNLGVVVYHNSSIVRDYFGGLGVPLANVSFAGGSEQVFFDFATGRAVDGYTPVSSEALGAAIQKYAGIYTEKYPYLSLGYDVPNPVPEELLAPYADFIKDNDLGDIVQQVNSIAGCNGNLLERPTIYGLKVFSPLLVQAAAAGFINAASGNNLDLYQAAQSRLNDKESVVLQSHIKKVTRSQDGVQVVVKTPKGRVVVKAKKLVLAIPPTLDSLTSIGLDLTSDEKELFSKFKGFLYGSTVFTHQGIDTKRSFGNIGTNTPYNLLTLPGSYSIGPLLSANVSTNKISAYFGGLDADLSEKDIKDLVKGELDNLAKAGNIGQGEPDFKYFGNHAPYHIHVSPEDIREGFYSKLYDLEGQKNTFWTGAAFVDNDSTLIWTWTESHLLKLIQDSLA